MSRTLTCVLPPSFLSSEGLPIISLSSPQTNLLVLPPVNFVFRTSHYHQSNHIRQASNVLRIIYLCFGRIAIVVPPLIIVLRSLTSGSSSSDLAPQLHQCSLSSDFSCLAGNSWLITRTRCPLFPRLLNAPEKKGQQLHVTMKHITCSPRNGDNHCDNFTHVKNSPSPPSPYFRPAPVNRSEKREGSPAARGKLGRRKRKRACSPRRVRSRNAKSCTKAHTCN